MLHRAVMFAAAFCLLAGGLAVQAQPPDDPLLQSLGRKVVVVPVEGMITDATLDGMQRRVDDALEAGAEIIVFEINTFGGMVSSALDICSYIKRLNVETVAWVNPKAISAGAMIAIACKSIVVSPASRFGDCAPIAMDPVGGVIPMDATERAKQASPILKEFKDSALRNGYPLVLCEAMIQLGPAVYMIRDASGNSGGSGGGGEVRYVFADELPQYGLPVPAGAVLGRAAPAAEPKVETQTDAPAEVAAAPAPGRVPGEWEVVKQVSGPHELLTLLDTEAVEYGFARRIINDDEALTAFLGATELVRIETTWSENLVAFLTFPLVRLLLIIAVILGIYLEMQSPGVGFPGAVAAVALIILLVAPFLAGLAGVLDLALIALGVILLGVEVFVLPGFGVAGISGLALIALGLIMTFVENDPGPGFWPSLPGTWRMFEQGMITVLLALVIGGIGLGLLIRYFGALPLVGRMILRDAQPSMTSPGPSMAPDEYAAPVQAGAVGKTVTGLRPVGRAEFDGKIVDVITYEGWIESGRQVRVVEAAGNRVLVEEIA